MNIKDTGLFRCIVQSIHYLFVREYISSFCEVTDLVDGYGFTYPITVRVTQSRKDVFLVACPIFNLYTEGKTFDEALNNIKSLIVDDYLAFQRDYPNGLSDDAVSCLRLYCALFGYDVKDILND